MDLRTTPRTSLALAAMLALTAALGPVGCSDDSGLGPPRAFITVTPESTAVKPMDQVEFHAEVSGLPETDVYWYVNGYRGGTGEYGTISTEGLYTAPGAPPQQRTVTIMAASVVDTALFGEAKVTVTEIVTVEMEDYEASHEVGADTIRIVRCGAASGGYAVEGFDTPGESIVLRVTFDQPATYGSVLRAAALKGARSEIRITLQEASSGVQAGEALYEIEGKGVT